jgi:kinetochore protein NDC80
MRQDILNYLQSNGFDISMASLSNIQGKDYRAIFDFLLLTLDPSHPLGQNARFEDEFVPALKSLRYPFAHQIDNKWLAAPASMHSWPSLLGVLHWLVEVCKVCRHSGYEACTLNIEVHSAAGTLFMQCTSYVTKSK